jgi:uncharacterized NAD(P)/FAD-binding protein YdhS
MDQKRLLQLAGVKPLHEAWGGEMPVPAAAFDTDGDDTDGDNTGDSQSDRMGAEGDNQMDAVDNLQSWIRRAARKAKRDGMSKEDFDHRILEMVDSVWRQMQTIRQRGERVGSTPRF